MNVTPQGLAVLAEACGMASARALSVRTPYERLNADLAATCALIRAAQADLRRRPRDQHEIERRLRLLGARLREIRAAHVR